MTATEQFDVATLNHTYLLPAPLPAIPPVGPSEELVRFAHEMEDYKRRHNRPFPTWSEVLEVIRSLGYAKRVHLAAATPFRVQVTRSGEDAGRLAEILVRYGGNPLPALGEGHYGFRIASDRARALDAARADQGWTSVEPR